MMKLSNVLKAAGLVVVVAAVGVLSLSCSEDEPTSPRNTAPSASVTVMPSSGTTETDFEFDASGCTDGQDAISELEVRWDWEDDGTWDTSYSATKAATHRYATEGTKTIKLEVKDTGGLTDSTTLTVTVSDVNTAPVASFTVNPTSGTTGTDFEFDASGCTDAQDDVSVLEVRWDWESDGVWDTSYSMTKRATRRYGTTGTKTIKLEVKDLGGLTDETTRDISIGGAPSPPEMIQVPAGVFTMGDGAALCGVDRREVTLTRDFLLGQHEVTNQEYMEAVQWAYDNGYVTATTTSVRDNLDGSTQELLDLDDEDCEIQFDGAGTFYLRESPSSYAQDAYPGGYDPADHPVKEVTWYGAARYCDWLSLLVGLARAYQHAGDWACNGGDPYGAEGYRLPTDAEWEYAAQWNDERIYPWGNEAPDCSRANFYNNDFCVGWTVPVGSYPDAPASLGLSDMAGNLWEWCNDWHACDLGTSSETDPTGPESGTYCVLRGGNWIYGATDLRCASRDYGEPPDNSDYYMGFRASRTVSP